MRLFLPIFLSLTLLAPSLTAESKVGHPNPFPSELLHSPIHLPNCPPISIVEWANPDPEEVRVVDYCCHLAFSNFPAFMEKEGLEHNNSPNFNWNISIIPIDRQYRHLNDIDFRFYGRTIWNDSNGNPLLIPGFTNYTYRHIFIYNQVMEDQKPNPRFITIMTHEFFHAFSYSYGVYQRHSGDKVRKDEVLAMKFTRWLGLGE